MVDNLYIKDKNYDINHVKLQIHLEVEKFNLIRTIHKDNGHLWGNRTVSKIIEKGFQWDNIIKDVLDYIKYESKECINMKSGERIVVKSKILITKGPKERYVFDGFQLDELTKELTDYSYIIEIIQKTH